MAAASWALGAWPLAGLEPPTEPLPVVPSSSGQSSSSGLAPPVCPVVVSPGEAGFPAAGLPVCGAGFAEAGFPELPCLTQSVRKKKSTGTFSMTAEPH